MTQGTPDKGTSRSPLSVSPWYKKKKKCDLALAAIGLAVSHENERSEEILLKMGVPAEAIRVLPGRVDNTVAELRAISARLSSGPASYLVTSKYHSRRVRVIWNAVARQRLATVRYTPEDPYDADRWWGTSTDALATFTGNLRNFKRMGRIPGGAERPMSHRNEQPGILFYLFALTLIYGIFFMGVPIAQENIADRQRRDIFLLAVGLSVSPRASRGASFAVFAGPRTVSWSGPPSRFPVTCSSRSCCCSWSRSSRLPARNWCAQRTALWKTLFASLEIAPTGPLRTSYLASYWNSPSLAAREFSPAAPWKA